eukprot:8393104-Ditylum_brightwellii.AAC.1
MYIRENAFSAENAHSQASVVPDWARPNYRLLVQAQGKWLKKRIVIFSIRTRRPNKTVKCKIGGEIRRPVMFPPSTTGLFDHFQTLDEYDIFMAG